MRKKLTTYLSAAFIFIAGITVFTVLSGVAEMETPLGTLSDMPLSPSSKSASSFPSNNRIPIKKTPVTYSINSNNYHDSVASVKKLKLTK